MQRVLRGDQRRLLRFATRGLDLTLLAGGVTAALLAPVPPGCSAPSAALAPFTLLVVGFALGLGRGRFRYGSAPDLLALLIGAAAAVATGATLSSACGSGAVLFGLVPALLLAAPRTLVALSRGRPVAGQAGASESSVLLPSAAAAVHVRTAWIVTLSRPVDEPRVRRQADALYQSGWNVVAVGYRGAAPKPDFWTLIEIPGSPRPRVAASALAEVLRPEGLWQPWAFLAARFSGNQAERYYWGEQLHRQNFEDIVRAAAVHGLRCDLVANHDFYTLPIAARLAREHGVPFTTDVHEYARGQYMHRLGFRLLYAHYVHSLQKRFFPQAALLTVVCAGIAQLLHRQYALQRAPLVVRNVSIYEPMPWRPTAERIRVLYHGLLCEARGLEETIRSMPLWRDEFELVLRGPAEPGYAESLQRLARRHGVEARLRFERALPLTELIAAANHSDIGFFASADYSPQKMFTAPNKLFEYLMAGLALCVSDLPEMRAVVAQHDLGRMFGSLEPRAIADAINGFTRESIAHHKRQSLAAARVLCWESEREPLMRAYEEISKFTARC
jgi:glycosyltransferase involved in cell wall biosynthesis